MWQQILIYSTNDQFLTRVQAMTRDLQYSFRLVRSVGEVRSIEATYKPAILILESNDKTAEIKTALATLALKFKTQPVLLVYDGQSQFNIRQLKEWAHRITAIQSTMDKSFFLDCLFEMAPVEIPPEKLRLEHLLPVRLSDVRGQEKLPFSLYYYMPKNERIILYKRKNTALEPAHLERFKNGNVTDLYILRTESKVFVQYSVSKLKNVLKTTPPTLRREELKKEVRNLFADFFDPEALNEDQAQGALNNCRKVVGEFINELNPNNPDLFQQILNLAAHNKTSYNHALNVSTYLSLFTLAVGLDTVDAAAIGGLLHDIGLAMLPSGVGSKQYKSLSAEDQSVYEAHVAEGALLLKNKKIPASEQVLAIMSEHHENFDGSGYPNGLKGEEIHVLARICHIADDLDYLTSTHEGKAPMKPMEAFEHMIGLCNGQTGRGPYDLDLLQKIYHAVVNPSVVPIDREKLKGLGKPMAPMPGVSGPVAGSGAQVPAGARVPSGAPATRSPSAVEKERELSLDAKRRRRQKQKFK